MRVMKKLLAAKSPDLKIKQRQVMAAQMRFLKRILKNLRAEISTHELLINPQLLRVIQATEYQLQQMERKYDKPK